MKFCYNTNFTLPKQSQRSRSVLQDGSTSSGLFWKEKTPSYNRRNTVVKHETEKFQEPLDFTLIFGNSFNLQSIIRF